MLIRSAASARRGMPFEHEVSCKFSGHRAGQQDMVGLLHDQPSDSDRMDEAFEGSDRARLEPLTFHERSIHPLDAVQLSSRSSPGIEQSGAFEHLDRAFDGEQRAPFLPEHRIAGGQRLGKTRRLARRDRAPARTAMSENQGMRTDQLRRRFLACR